MEIGSNFDPRLREIF